MKTIVIFGGTGFIGTNLADHLINRGNDVYVVGRNKPRTYHEEFIQWDGHGAGDWHTKLPQPDVIINLVGKSVDCIKTPDNIDEILRSRCQSIVLIRQWLDAMNYTPELWIQMSTAHIYGDNAHTLDDDCLIFGYGLAPYVGKQWEKTFLEYVPTNTREIRMRTSFVLAKNGGALHDLKRIVKLGLGGKVGSGKQGISWIHIDDFCELVSLFIQDNTYKGAYIISSPKPESNRLFMKALRTKLRYPIGLPSPAFLVKFGAKYIFKTDYTLALYGRYVYPSRLVDGGYRFKYNTLMDALKAC